MLKLISIQEVMKGLKPGSAQTAGNMTVIPLISDIVDDTIASPEVLEMQTQGYGTVIAYNTGTQEESGLTISPLGNVIMTKQAAQNHAIPNMKVIQKGETVRLDKAACVQQRQGGYIQKGRYRIMLLPLAIREDAIENRKGHNYGKLWESISRFNEAMGLQKVGHLEYFMTKYRQEMDEFVAQFEVVPNQVGAIILIDGEVAGIERCPNYHFFKVMWEPLIRECYGSMSIQSAQANNYRVPKNRVPLSPRRLRTVADIRAALSTAKAEENKRVKKVIKRFIRDNFKKEKDEEMGGFTVETLSNRQFKGQMVRKNDIPLMFSLVKTKKWMSDPNQEKFANADEFRM